MTTSGAAEPDMARTAISSKAKARMSICFRLSRVMIRVRDIICFNVLPWAQRYPAFAKRNPGNPERDVAGRRKTFEWGDSLLAFRSAESSQSAPETGQGQIVVSNRGA